MATGKTRSKEQRKALEKKRLAAARRAQRRRSLMLSGLVVALVVAVVAGILLTRGGGPESPGPPSGVKSYGGLSRAHVQGPVTYPQTPPVGGEHSPVWQNCGFYDAPVANENAVHSMEHGAVWITFRPDLPASDVDVLRSLAAQPYVLVSPYPKLPAPVVASAWGEQLRLDSVQDPRLRRFVDYFSQGPQTPEPGAPCTGGRGTPS